MSTASDHQEKAGKLTRFIGLLRNLFFGTLLCLLPITAILALGWQTRRMNAAIRIRWGERVEQPGWILGAPNSSWLTRSLGGLAMNVRSGLISFAGLAVLSLPFTVLWSGAWWAGWENSFNKGYEQAGIGPAVWFFGMLIALPILTHLPFGLAHASFQNRFGAFFELGRIRSVVSSAGWRTAWIALMSVSLCIPFMGMRAIPVFIEGIVPGFAGMAPEGQSQVAFWLDLLAAALAFGLVLFLRQRAAVIYALAAPRAATGRFAPLWDGHTAQSQSPVGRSPSKPMAAVWLVVACIIWSGLPALIVVGQFMNYKAMLWLTHPVFLLPWAG